VTEVALDTVERVKAAMGLGRSLFRA